MHCDKQNPTHLTGGIVFLLLTFLLLTFLLFLSLEHLTVRVAAITATGAVIADCVVVFCLRGVSAGPAHLESQHHHCRRLQSAPLRGFYHVHTCKSKARFDFVDIGVREHLILATTVRRFDWIVIGLIQRL
jgi:hypothetical protein